ncbi:hypothetical protein FSARC_6174 [Fusarium sarcochroum]|uniref:Uncharacterized protein n=1 Tax=Fusarium sarcochroum TaxID=1208366 RepID=A0A8H4X8R5_9HYPO|nr:hypothetical protein FSARC_6174 [Fusarium sarcochroum]
MPRHGRNWRYGYNTAICRDPINVHENERAFAEVRRKNSEESERINRQEEEANDLTYLDLAALARDEPTPAILIKLTTADANTFARRRENHLFKRFLVGTVGVSTSCPDCMAMKRVEEWAQNTMFRVVSAVWNNDTEEFIAETTDEETQHSSEVGDESSSDTQESGDESNSHEEIAKFEGDNLIAF